MKEVSFLGHFISNGGGAVDPTKVKDVLSWNPPIDVSEIRSFLGMAGYYRRFIEGFSKLAKPMTALLEKNVAEYVAICDTCQRVKTEHQRPAGLLQPMKIPEWKCEEVGMDFIVGLPRTQKGYDTIWVIVDRLTKVAHFLPFKTKYMRARLAELYMERIVCFHGVPKKIVSDRGTQFISHFWQNVHESLVTKLTFSSVYHPQTDGQTERTNQILEDMLRACALQYGTS